MKTTHSKKIDDMIWRVYLKDIKNLEENVKKLDHPMIKKSYKEELYSNLVIQFTDELENKMIRDELC